MYTQPGEELAVARTHQNLAAQLPGLRTIVVPADGGRCGALSQALVEQLGLSVDVWDGAGGTCESAVLLC